MARAPHKISALVILALGLSWSASMRVDHRGIETGAATVDPEFSIELRRNLLFMSGHAVSSRHEQRLRQAAAASFPEYALQAEFTPLGVAPPWWDDATTELVTALATLASAGAYLDEDSLRIEALVPGDAAPQLQRLRDVLPGSINLSVRLVHATPDIDVDAICAQQFAEFAPGPVGFEESGDEMLSSAYPALDRVVALADACRDSRIAITGHTDSSGNEAWNRQLSLARARAVAAWIEGRGIDADRIDIMGAGSSIPVADNATRYGRSLNRRIDVRLETAD